MKTSVGRCHVGFGIQWERFDPGGAELATRAVKINFFFGPHAQYSVIIGYSDDPRKIRQKTRYLRGVYCKEVYEHVKPI